nr:hypothetical protein [Legionella jordanis]
MHTNPSNQALSPFISLPHELKVLIVLFLSESDWFSLRLVNSAWKSAVAAVAKIHLDTVQRQFTQLLATDFDLLYKELMESLAHTFADKDTTNTVKKLMAMGESLAKLEEPLAKLLFLTGNLEHLDRDLSTPFTDTSLNLIVPLIFPRRNEIRKVIQPTLEICQQFSQSYWFQNTLTYSELCPVHQVARTVSQARSKVRELERKNAPDIETPLRLPLLKDNPEESCRMPVSFSLSFFPKIKLTPPTLSPRKQTKEKEEQKSVPSPGCRE